MSGDFAGELVNKFALEYIRLFNMSIDLYKCITFQTPTCAAFSYYYDVDPNRPGWFSACVGRVEFPIFEDYPYSFSGIRQDINGRKVFQNNLI